MEKEISQEQLHSAICQAMQLTASELGVLLEMMPTLQPGQKELVKRLLDERSTDKQQLTFLNLMNQFNWGLGDKAVDYDNSRPLNLPGGYQVAAYPDFPDQFYVFRIRDGAEVVYAEDLTSREEAIATAYELDRTDDPYRWRSMDETCPAQVMLLFACANWEHSVQLGKPVPVNTGYRGEDSIRLFGGSWKPTNWCYQPEAPQCVKAAQPSLA